MTIRVIVQSFVWLLLPITTTFAHHSSAPHFDNASEITVTGKITELKLVNPHSYLYFDVEQDGETANWRCELSAATQLRRRGWSAELLPVGEEVTIVGDPARREDNVCYLETLTLSSGQVVKRYGNLTDAVATSKDIDVAAERPLRLANGQPNLQGPWVTLSFGRNAREGIKPRYTSTATGKAAAAGYEMAFDDPILECHYVNLINGWIHDENVNDIIQQDDTITLQYGFMDVVRTIHLTMEEHPADITPSSTGHSIGKWEGDTLVVHTVGFIEGVLNHSSGQKHSDQMEVTERFRYDPDSKKLIRDYLVIDPLYLVGETTGQDVMALSNEPYSPYGCVELSGKNNVRPTDALYDQIDESGVKATSATTTMKVENVKTENQQEGSQ